MRTTGLNLLVWLLLTGGVSVQAQVENLSYREDDARLATVDLRQSVLDDILSKARDVRDKGDLNVAARLLTRAGWLQARLHKPDEALATYREVLNLTKNSPNLFVEVDSLNGMAWIYAETSKCDQAQAVLGRALALTAQGNYDAGRAESLLIRSECQNHADHELALRTARKALTLWESVDNKWGIGQAYMMIGDYQFSQSDLIAASESLNTALNIWTELNLSVEKAEVLINLGFIEYRRGAWQASILILTEVRKLIDENAEPYRMGQIDGTIAEAFIEAGSPEIGLEKLKSAIEYFRRANSPRAGIIMYWNLGRAHYMLGNYDEARKNLETGFSEAQSIDEPIFGALCAEYLGRTHAAIDDSATALKQYSWALERYRKGTKPMEAARTTALIGQLYQERGRLNEARRNYQQALSKFRQLADRLNESATLYALGTLELQQNNLGSAEKYLRQSIEVTENIRRVSTSNDLTTAFSATVQERYESLIECLMRKNGLSPSRSAAVEAFEMSELARARSLAEFFRATHTTALDGVEAELAKKEHSLRQELRVKEDSKVALLATDYKHEQLTALDSQIEVLDTEHRQILETIKARHPAYEQITEPPVWDLQRIQEEVIADDDTILLEFSLGSEKSYLWATTRTDFASYELPPKTEINSAIETVYESVKNPPRDSSSPSPSTAPIQQLSDMLLKPVAGKLKKHIIVVADGTLHYVPFQLLITSENKALVANHVVVNAPSASILGYLEQQAARRQTREHTLAAFGDPVFESNFRGTQTGSADQANVTQTPGADRSAFALRDIEVSGDSVNAASIQPLFYAKRELAMLREIGGNQSLIATGFDASRERLKNADLTRYAILHFAAHGILDPKRPENSGIFLSMIQQDGKPQNGYISLQDIYGLRAPVDLVVLSACRTGLGKHVRGEGIIGLTRGFMYAGASSVVASLWKVDDEATSELMKRFYSNMLQRGMRPAEALQAAQNSIRQEPQWSSPFYWAAFTIQGDYRNDIKTARVIADSTPVVPIAIGFALLASTLWVSYRRMRLGLRSIQA